MRNLFKRKEVKKPESYFLPDGYTIEENGLHEFRWVNGYRASDDIGNLFNSIEEAIQNAHDDYIRRELWAKEYELKTTWAQVSVKNKEPK